MARYVNFPNSMRLWLWDLCLKSIVGGFSQLIHESRALLRQDNNCVCDKCYRVDSKHFCLLNDKFYNMRSLYILTYMNFEPWSKNDDDDCAAQSCLTLLWLTRPLNVTPKTHPFSKNNKWIYTEGRRRKVCLLWNHFFLWLSNSRWLAR